jgi:hypothetical protein
MFTHLCEQFQVMARSKRESSQDRGGKRRLGNFFMDKFNYAPYIYRSTSRKNLHGIFDCIVVVIKGDQHEKIVRFLVVSACLLLSQLQVFAKEVDVNLTELPYNFNFSIT